MLSDSYLEAEDWHCLWNYEVEQMQQMAMAFCEVTSLADMGFLEMGFVRMT